MCDAVGNTVTFFIVACDSVAFYADFTDIIVRGNICPRFCWLG